MANFDPIYLNNSKIGHDSCGLLFWHCHEEYKEKRQEKENLH